MQAEALQKKVHDALTQVKSEPFFHTLTNIKRIGQAPGQNAWNLLSDHLISLPCSV